MDYDVLLQPQGSTKLLFCEYLSVPGTRQAPLPFVSNSADILYPHLTGRNRGSARSSNPAQGHATINGGVQMTTQV